MNQQKARKRRKIVEVHGQSTLDAFKKQAIQDWSPPQAAESTEPPKSHVEAQKGASDGAGSTETGGTSRKKVAGSYDFQPDFTTSSIGVATDTSNKVVTLQQTLGSAPEKPVHLMHRKLQTFYYSGPLPSRGGEVHYWGRHRNIPRYVFEYPEYKARVVAMSKCFKVWIHHPPGIKTADQVFEAHTLAWKCALDFARKHGVRILRWNPAQFSEHTVENSALDAFLRPIVEANPDLCDRKLGLVIDKSHTWPTRRGQPRKYKLEWRKGKLTEGPIPEYERVMKIEWLSGHGFDDLMATLQELRAGNATVLDAQGKIFALIKEIAEFFNSLKKPPEGGIQPIEDDDKKMFR